MAEAAIALGTNRNVIAGRAKRLGVMKGNGKGGHVPARSAKEPCGCLWIDGEVSSGNWSYCQAEPRKPGEPWCAHHRRIVYRRPADPYLQEFRVSAPGLGRGGVVVRNA